MVLLTLMLGACAPQPDVAPEPDRDTHSAKDAPPGASLTFVPLLPASIEGHQAGIDGVFAVLHGCPYLVTTSGDEYLLAFMLRPVAATSNGALAFAGSVIASGDAITATGGEITGLRHGLTWEHAPPTRCDDGKVWAVVALKRR